MCVCTCVCVYMANEQERTCFTHTYTHKYPGIYAQPKGWLSIIIPRCPSETRVQAVVISRSAATHAERLPIEHGPRRTPWVIGRESSRLHIVQPPISKGS